VTRLDTLKAVLLDMDGTLVDSDGAVERAWMTWSAEYGVDPSYAMHIAHGSPAATTIRQLLPHLSDDEVDRATQREHELQYDDLADVEATTGAVELIDTMERLGLVWAVVTSADLRLARARLGSAGITPPLLVTIDDVTDGKPDPEGYLLAARRLGVETARCLVVEDSEPGLVAGRRAGAVTAALRGLDGDYSIRDLGELVAALDRALGPKVVSALDVG
jgi:HAD superfamily hydrolase (TIGR01509 family)